MAGIPRQIQRIQGGIGLFPALGHHAGEAGLLIYHDLDHARHGLGPASRRAFEFSFDGGRMRHRAVRHAGQAHVDAVGGLAQHLGAQIDARHGFADVAELRVRLERRRLLRHGQRWGRGHDLAVGAAHGRIGLDEDIALLGRSLFDRPAQLARPFCAQHLAHGGAGLAQDRVQRGDGVAGAGADRVVQALPGGCAQHLEVLPGGLQLVRRRLRQGRVHALAHLDLGQEEAHPVVRQDLEPGRGRGLDADRRAARRIQVIGDLQAGIGQAQHAQPHQGGCAARPGHDEKLAAGDPPLLLGGLGWLAHIGCAGLLAHSPPSWPAISAARATARLMRG